MLKSSHWVKYMIHLFSTSDCLWDYEMIKENEMTNLGTN